MIEGFGKDCHQIMALGGDNWWTGTALRFGNWGSKKPSTVGWESLKL